jgi:hypothetical protein
MYERHTKSPSGRKPGCHSHEWSLVYTELYRIYFRSSVKEAINLQTTLSNQTVLSNECKISCQKKQRLAPDGIWTRHPQNELSLNEKEKWAIHDVFVKRIETNLTLLWRWNIYDGVKTVKREPCTYTLFRSHQRKHGACLSWAG